MFYDLIAFTCLAQWCAALINSTWSNVDNCALFNVSYVKPVVECALMC